MAINVERQYTNTGLQQAIPLNRHGNPQYSVVVGIGGGGDVSVEGTISRINVVGVTPVWFPIINLTNLVADTADKIIETPLEAVRVNVIAVTDTINFQIMQNT
jgi:hypothetical protein